ncbi:Methylmalonic aciduria type A homolog, partial [Durusdinium trenchii]
REHAELMRPETRRLAEGLVNGDRVCLSRAITLIESLKEDHHMQAQYLLEYVLREKKENKTRKESFRLGIAGPPGAGKSTFIEALGSMLVQDLGLRVAVLAVDPSSSRTGGSILGDKTRMTDLSRMPDAYVRPSPTRGSLGGVAQHTNDVVLLCEAADFEIIIVETVGLGQSEVLVDETVDMLMLLVPPANGDELQGVKKGIMEVADMVVVNKADGELATAARHAATDYMHALQLMRRKRPIWRPRVKKCSALHKEQIDTVWNIVEKFRRKMPFRNVPVR